MNHHNRMLVLSGPSCVGKSPLRQAFWRAFPKLVESFQVPILYHSRPPRPDEREGEQYHFRSRQELERLRSSDRHEVVDVRGDLQAVDMLDLREMLRKGPVFYEGNEHIALMLKRNFGERAQILDVFLSPLARDELLELRKASADIAGVVSELMRRRLMRRALSKRPFLTLPDLRDIERRALSAYHSLAHAHEFSYVIVNHDGEDSDHWDVFQHPLGDARRAVHALAALMCGDRTPAVETWSDALLDLNRDECAAGVGGSRSHTAHAEQAAGEAGPTDRND